MGLEQLIDDIRSLPESLREQVADYVAFLRQRYHTPAAGGTEFWALLTHIDWSEDGDEAKLAPLVATLAELPLQRIYDFQDRLSYYLTQLDGPAYWAAFSSGPDGGSADSFLYARCEVVARGRAYYERVLTNPTKFPHDAWLEQLLNVPDKAYQLQTGEELTRLPKYNYESFFNPEHWIDQAPVINA